MLTSPRSTRSVSTTGGPGRASSGRGVAGSRLAASVSNLADRELLDTSQPLFSQLGRQPDALPEELQTRSGWTLATEPQLAQLMTAVIEDNYNRMAEFLPLLRQLTARLSGFKIELATRSGVKISCRSMFLGHVLCLCASPRVLQLLQTHDVLSTSLFAKKVNLTIDFAPQSDLPEDSVFAMEQRQFAWRQVPSFFMVILRDSFDSFDWLVRHGFLRKLTDTDEDGRNILHASVEMESPFVLTNVLTKDSGGCLSANTLQALFRQADRSPAKLTPLLKACYAESTAMLCVLLQNLPQAFLVGELDASGRSENLISTVISHVKDSAVSSEFVGFLLNRGATPDTAYFDKRSCLEVLINSEHFNGYDLCHLVQRLINAKARVSLSVMITCLSCTFRTDQEILEIACELLAAAGASVLSDAHQSEMKELGEETLDMETNVVVQMLRNPQIPPATVRTLLKHFARHINIPAIFPSVQQIFPWQLLNRRVASFELQQTGVAPRSGDGGDENAERGNWTGKLDFFLSCLGYAVGLGNVWRFPYLCYKNGGGAFFIPYFLFLFLCGMPIFCMELAIGQFSSAGPLTCWECAPLFRGIGVGMVLVSSLGSIYYNVIISWSIWYLFASFSNPLPWAECGSWSTQR